MRVAIQTLITLAFAALFSLEAHAVKRTIVVLDSSTSGRIVRVSIGAKNGMVLGEAVLFSSATNKIAAGRVIRVEDSSAVIAVLEKYGKAQPQVDIDYELLYGEPFPEAENLPDYIVDREEEKDNPANEKFWAKDAEDSTPELDDENYAPEIALRPKFPLPKTYTPHNITIGLQIFRNRSLPAAGPDSSETVDDPGTSSSHTTYNGYGFRYAYTWRSNYWLKSTTAALLSAEFGMGMYNFEHTFPPGIRPDPNDDVTQVRVIPIHLGLRYLVEVSRLFRLYPYVGWQYNLVSAVNGSLIGLEPLMGGRLLGGLGAVLVMSDTVDARLEGGSDGVLGGLVVKF